ncbi:MAG: UDP-N-acetylmuramate--L-alanine ligase [Deltaproteobacteria bacterium]|nr:UDP-N-acetylmuramate--L-alanine ligase [Deltaproteobacteria bacterium]
MFRGKVRQIHFVGIGGTGMCGIAEVLRTMAYRVSGSDVAENEAVRRLRTLGVDVRIGHDPDPVGEADVVVRSSAVSMDNVEIREAVRRGIPVIPRAEMLAELMRLKYGLAVAGTHGKTTVTSMLATCLHAAGLDPTVVIGGRLDRLESNAALGEGPYLVAEADESDGSFLLLAPTVAVVTNVDPEHLDHYGTYDHLVDTFVDFANKVPFYGYAVLCLDHPVVQQMLPRVRRRVVTYGLTAQAEFRGEDVVVEGFQTRFAAFRDGERLGVLSVAMPGVHNARNALAAVAAAVELDVPFETAAGALEDFGGVQRRFTRRGEVAGRLVIDDYAHHPVEIAATLDAARAGFPDRRLVAVFQPHRYSRVRHLFGGFATAFNQADAVLVCPIYPAGEPPMDGVDELHLAEEIRAHGHRQVRAVGSLDEALTVLLADTRPGDLVVMLGAGDVTRLCPRLLEALEGAG